MSSCDKWNTLNMSTKSDKVLGICLELFLYFLSNQRQQVHYNIDYDLDAEFWVSEYIKHMSVLFLC